jgi:hypothetical protein
VRAPEWACACAARAAVRAGVRPCVCARACVRPAPAASCPSNPTRPLPPRRRRRRHSPVCGPEPGGEAGPARNRRSGESNQGHPEPARTPACRALPLHPATVPPIAPVQPLPTSFKPKPTLWTRSNHRRTSAAPRHTSPSPPSPLPPANPTHPSPIARGCRTQTPPAAAARPPPCPQPQSVSRGVGVGRGG